MGKARDSEKVTEKDSTFKSLDQTPTNNSKETTHYIDGKKAK
jgi:hypothetical protein